MRTTSWLPLLLLGLGATACGDAISPADPGTLVPRTVAEDPTLPAIEMNGSRFHVQTVGDPSKPVVIFLHKGPGGDFRSMLRLADRYDGRSLADRYFLVFWDQRGAGLSKRHDRSQLTIGKYVDDLDALIDRYSPTRPVYLVGHSWGGMLATRYINDHPQRVAGAVLIEPGPLTGATMERVKDDMYDTHLGAEWLNDWAWGSQFLSPDDHARMDFERVLAVGKSQPRFHLSKVDPEPGWRLGAAANRYVLKDGQNANGTFDYDFTTQLAAYRTPVLFIAGGLSEVLGESLQREQVQRFPSATLAVVPGAGHDVQWVKAAAVLDLTWNYLTTRTGGAQ